MGTICSLEKSVIKQNIISHDLFVIDNHLIYRNRLVNAQRLSSKGLYGILITLKSTILTSQNYFNNRFAHQSLNWKNIYVLPSEVMLDSHMRVFQYKILYLNKKKLSQ